jgi:hypothetical protein
MFQYLDATLSKLVQAELSLRNVAISFAGPDDQFPPQTVTLPAIAFFLYDIRENLELRDKQWETEIQAGGVATRKRVPVRVDCSYLITAWPGSAAPDPTGDEHTLLGEVLKVLLRHRRIPREYLQGELIDQEPPVRAKVIGGSQLQSLGEFWQAMGGTPKAMLHYAITISVDVFEAEDAGPRVTEKVIRVGPLAGPE